MGRTQLLTLIVATTFSSTFVSCKETTLDDRPCPSTGTSLTYENFGKAFMSTYCQNCHGATSNDRKGAPGRYDFGTLDDIRNHRSRIFSRAAADNTTMPPGPDDPPSEERERLADWLACGAP